MEEGSLWVIEIMSYAWYQLLLQCFFFLLHFQLLLQCMDAALHQEVVEVKAHCLSRAVVGVHHVLGKARPRLQAVLDLAACHPQAIHMLQQTRHDPETLGPNAEPELVSFVYLRI
jgi:hypothetical protein